MRPFNGAQNHNHHLIHISQIIHLTTSPIKLAIIAAHARF